MNRELLNFYFQSFFITMFSLGIRYQVLGISIDSKNQKETMSKNI